MEIICNQNELNNDIQLVGKAVASRPTHPILANILLTADQGINTDANIVPISNGNIDTDKILNTGLFDFERAQQAPGWLKEMRGEHVPETEEYGISSFVYEARRPFYPQKFFDFLHSDNLSGKLIRSKGFF